MYSTDLRRMIPLLAFIAGVSFPSSSASTAGDADGATSNIQSGNNVDNSEIFSLILSLRLRSTALWLSLRLRRFSFNIAALQRWG